MKSYEELHGAQGRHVFYRAERFRAADLFTQKPPAVLVGGERFTLDNLSMSGVALSARHDGNLSQGSEDEIAIVFEGDNKPLFRSSGQVRRVENRGFDTRVALSFTGAPLNISNLVDRYNESLLMRELNGGLHHSLDLVAPQYRQHCVDVLHLLRRYQATIKKFESSMGGADGSPDQGRSEKFFDLCESRLLPEWRKLWRDGNELVRPLSSEPELMTAAKEFTEYVLTPELVGGPIWNRSYYKPLGYPGDFEVMNYVYEWRNRGEGVYEKLLHRIGLDVAECIATRMVMIQQIIADTVMNLPASDAPARILSLGCGPAQEVQNYLDVKSLPRPVEITLVDQDQEALSHAYANTYPKVMTKSDGSTVRCLQVSFVELMKAGKIFVSLPPQDLIYTVGLVDYLSTKRVQELATNLYEKLAEGGQLNIGNMADVEMGNQWPMEFICDWGLHYRDKSEMIEFAALLPPEAELEIIPDPTGRVYMLQVRKPRTDS